MECERCFKSEEIRYRVYSDVIDMKVCDSCAEEAQKLGIAVEALDLGKRREAEVNRVTETHHSYANR